MNLVARFVEEKSKKSLAEYMAQSAGLDTSGAKCLVHGAWAPGLPRVTKGWPEVCVCVSVCVRECECVCVCE